MNAKSEKNGGSAADSQADRLELLKWTLDGVQEQIRFADSKAGVVVLFHTFLFGFIISQAETLSTVGIDGRTLVFWLRLGLLAAYVVASVVSMCFAVAAVMPSPGLIAPETKIYHGHIVMHDCDFDGFHKDVLARSKAQWEMDVSSQILVNSHIACKKHRRVKYGASWAVAALICAVLGIGCFFLGAASAAQAHAQASQPDHSGQNTSR